MFDNTSWSHGGYGDAAPSPQPPEACSDPVDPAGQAFFFTVDG